MNLDELLDSVDLTPDAAAELADLRLRKARTRELGRAPVPQALGAWVEQCFAREDDRGGEASEARRDVARAGFLEMVDRWAPAG